MAKEILTIAPNLSTQETLKAFHGLYTFIYQSKPQGFGYFVIVDGLQYKWGMHGAARHHPELSIGILSVMKSTLTNGKF